MNNSEGGKRRGIANWKPGLLQRLGSQTRAAAKGVCVPQEKGGPAELLAKRGKGID